MLIRIRDVYDEFQWHKPFFRDELRRSQALSALVRDAKPEQILRYYYTEPQLRPFILYYLEARQERRAIAGLISTFWMPDPLLMLRAGASGQTISVHEETGLTLAALTGVDFGSDRDRWKVWWDENRSRFPTQFQHWY